MEDLGLPENYLKPLSPCFDLLKRCNIRFFDDDKPCFKKYWRYFYIIPCVVIYYSSLTAYALKIFKGQMELFELAYVIPVYVVCTQAIFKALVVIIHKKDVKSLVIQLGSTWRTDNLTTKQINKKNSLLKKLNFCYGAFYWMNIIGSWQYILAPLFETLIRRYIMGQECGFLLPFACSFPFDSTANWPTYITVYLFETYSMFRIVYSYLGSEFLLISLCSHLSTEFYLLREDLLHVTPVAKRNNRYSDGDEHYRVQLCDIVKRHQRLIQYSEQLDGIFNKMIFVNLSSATITVCFFSFAAKVSRGPLDMANNFVAVVALILPIFNLCYYAEMLTDASTGIAKSAYTNLWYKGNKQYKMSIWFIMKRAQKPCCLTSMKYNPIALHTFTTVLSTTWSYFSLASSLYEEDK